MSSDYTPETYKDVSRIEFPEWEGWEEIDRHKTMNGFPDNLKFSDVLEGLYKDWQKSKQ